MKKTLLTGLTLALGMAVASVGFADTTAAPSSQMDKVSYAIGYNVGSDFKKQNIAVVPAQLAAGMQAALSGSTPALSDADMKSTLQDFQKQMMQQMQAKQDQVASANLAASNAYLTKVASEKGVMKITDGLYYKVLTAGKGPMPTANDQVQVNYEGTLINGKVFDSSFQRGKPVTFGVSQVIPGWTKALQQMPVGSTWTLYISPALAYGKFAPPEIGPNQALIFKVQLISIVPAAANTAAK
jgi:FKBP-type peptidyl-prolyl cis-trans isomerase FklB